MKMQKIVMDTPEVADYVGVCPSKIRQWIREKRIPYIRLDGRIVFMATEIFDWLKSKQVTPAAENISDKLTDDVFKRLKKDD
jgi:excisionase family DNA binding protein